MKPDDQSQWFKSRDTRAPYGRAEWRLCVSQSFDRAARERLWELPGHPFLSIGEFGRHLLAGGLIYQIEHGMPLDGLLDIYILAERAERILESFRAAQRIIDACGTLLKESRTVIEKERAREHVEAVIAGCKDPEIVEELLRQLKHSD